MPAGSVNSRGFISSSSRCSRAFSSACLSAAAFWLASVPVPLPLRSAASRLLAGGGGRRCGRVRRAVLVLPSWRTPRPLLLGASSSFWRRAPARLAASTAAAGTGSAPQESVPADGRGESYQPPASSNRPTRAPGRRTSMGQHAVPLRKRSRFREPNGQPNRSRDQRRSRGDRAGRGRAPSAPARRRQSPPPRSRSGPRQKPLVESRR